ncbi:MAG: Gldg family protein [Bacteroidetes bacterium]|nr:Gldg family protein [Bacteroidota bacterium]
MKLFDTKIKQASYSVLMVIIVLAVLLVVNLIAETLDLKFDLTEKGLFSLSEETISILHALEGEVDIYALYKPGRESKQIVGVLDQYSDYKRISVKIIDPDRILLFLHLFRLMVKPFQLGL